MRESLEREGGEREGEGERGRGREGGREGGRESSRQIERVREGALEMLGVNIGADDGGCSPPLHSTRARPTIGGSVKPCVT